MNGADLAACTYGMVVRISNRDFHTMVQSNMIKKCPVSFDYVRNAINIYGPNVNKLKGQTIQTQLVPVNTDEIYVLSELLDIQKNVDLTGDIMLVNKIAFLVLLSHNICFGTS